MNYLKLMVFINTTFSVISYYKLRDLDHKFESRFINNKILYTKR